MSNIKKNILLYKNMQDNSFLIISCILLFCMFSYLIRPLFVSCSYACMNDNDDEYEEEPREIDFTENPIHATVV